MHAFFQVGEADTSSTSRGRLATQARFFCCNPCRRDQRCSRERYFGICSKGFGTVTTAAHRRSAPMACSLVQFYRLPPPASRYFAGPTIFFDLRGNDLRWK